MADFIITGPDGKRYKVTGDSPEGAVGALKKMLGGSAEPDAGQVAMRARITAAKSGTLQASPESLARAADADAIAGANIQDAQDQAVIERTGLPLSYLTKFNQGIPFVGEYFDEATGMLGNALGKDGGAITAEIRANQAAMERQNPKSSMAAQLAGGVVGTLAAGRLAGPMVLARAPATLGAQIAAGAAAGAVAGGAEGVVSGYGAGNDGNRLRSAATRGAIGAGLGGIIGGLAPAAAAGASNLWQRFKGSDVRVIADQLGISPEAARVVKQAIEGDDLVAAQAAIDRAGGKAMLADAGAGTQKLLDAAVTYGNKAPGVVRDAVEDRARKSAAEMQGALDSSLGAATGQQTLKTSIRQGSATARQQAYDLAYSKPIDYASGRGKLLEGLFQRVPASAWRRADELMRLEGNQSNQILAQIGDDGSVTLSRLPDVRQIDYLTRALNDVADAADGQGKLGGTTALGRATGDLSRNLRTTLRSAVPEYGKALDTAADAISQSKATDLGYELLRAGTKREAVVQGLAGASKAERAAAKAGVRSYIDDTLANVRASISSPDLDIAEFRKLAGELRSRASQDKLTALLGKKEAEALYGALDKEVTGLELRAALAVNSKTAVRQGIRDSVREQTAPGVLGTLMQGKPIEASRRIVQSLTGTTPEAIAIRDAGIFDEIAQALVSKRGADAKIALQLIDRARQGQTVTDAQAKLIARAVGSAVALGGYQTGNQLLSTKLRGTGK